MESYLQCNTLVGILHGAYKEDYSTVKWISKLGCSGIETISDTSKSVPLGNFVVQAAFSKACEEKMI